MKKFLTLAITLFAVSAFAAGVAFKANPLALLQSGGGGGDKDKKAPVEQHLDNAPASNQHDLPSLEGGVRVSAEQVKLIKMAKQAIEQEQQSNLKKNEPIEQTVKE